LLGVGVGGLMARSGARAELGLRAHTDFGARGFFLG